MSEENGRFIGKSMLRKEDQRLLTGKGEFIADLYVLREIVERAAGNVAHRLRS